MKKLISALSSVCLAATSLLGAFPVVSAPDQIIRAKAADEIIYNLIPKNGEYISAEESGKKNNVYNAKAGEELQIDWTVKNDQGTAGIQMNLDFTQVEYVSAKKGNAYRITPTFSDYESGKGMKRGEVTYAFAQSSEAEANDNAVIYTFTVNVPNEKGTYSVGLDTGSKLVNKVVPEDQNNEHKFKFYGLDIVVDGGGQPQSTQGGDKLDASTIIYNLIPKNGEYISAEESGKKNNVYNAKAGEELQIDWTVKNDQGTAGIQMNLDFTQVEYVSAKKGNAYRITPTFSDYESGKGMKRGEVTYAFAQSSEAEANDNAVIYTFTVNVPNEKGTYSVGLDTGSKLVNKVVPEDQNNEHKFQFYGLDIVVDGGGEPQSTQGGDKPDASTIIYNLIPKNGDYTSAEESGKKNNVYNAKAGEELQIDWTVKNDQGTAGIQMNLDFTQVEYVSAKKGNAYRITPTFSDYESGKGMKRGEVTYAFAQSSEAEANDNAVIYTFTVNVPNEKGTYSVGLDTGSKLVNKVVPEDQNNEHKFQFYGLDIVVDGGGEPQSTQGGDKPDASTIIYNLIPKSGDYTSAEESGKKNNVYNAKAGEELQIDWTVKNDQGTAGIQMNLDFTQVEYVSAKKGNAYRITPTFSDYESGKGMKRGEVTYAFAQSSEAEANDNAVIYTFTVNVPNEKGTYSVGLDTGSKLVNKVVPEDQNNEHKFQFYGLDIVVDGSGQPQSTQGGDKPDASTIIYNLIPKNGDYTSAEESGKKNNVYNAKAGEELQIDWTVKNDQGTAGIQMYFDFKQVEYVSGSKGSAYRAVPTFSDYSNTSKLKRGEVVYAFAQSSEAEASDNAVIYTFKVNVPEEKGTYTVGLNQSEKSKVVPLEQDNPHRYVFYGLDIVVDGGGEPQSTQGGDKPDASTIIYNLIPKSGDYTSAEESGKKNNVYNAKAGEELQIDWTVKNDQGTAGIQMNLDFTQVEYVSAKKGNAYRITPTFSDYESGKGMKRGEVTYAFAQSSEAEANDNAVIYTFTVNVPNEKGTYSVGLDTGSKLVNKVVPEDQNNEHKFQFYGLDIVVDGGGEPQSTQGGDKPDASTIIYNLIPKNGDYTSAEESGKKNNVYNAKAGEELQIDWTVKNDQGTAGIQMNLDFTQVEYVSAKKGNAYRITPTFSDYESGKGMKRGEVTYAFAQSSEAEANDNAVIYTFTVNVPNEKGTYSVGLDTGSKLVNKVVPEDQNNEHKFQFYGLDIVVGEEPTTTTSDTTPPETTTTQTVTSEPESAGSAKWSIVNQTVAKGGAAKVPVVVKDDDGTAGFVAKFEFDNSLKFDRIEWANGYSGSAMINQDKQVVVWANPSGSNENADDTVLFLNFVAPEQEGNYPVRISSLDLTNTDGDPIEAKITNGSVTVDPNVVAAGEASWTIGKGVAKSGDTAIVPVIVKDPSGTAGITARFEYDPRLTFLGFEWGDQYSDAAELNPDKCSVVWANGNGTNESADGDVLYLKFTAPQEEGEYPVSFALLDVTNTDDQQLLVTRSSGAVVTDNRETEPPVNNLSIVSTYELKYTPPTRKNYWSHDTRTFKENGGLDGMTAELTVYKYYVNDKNEFVDAKGNTMNDGAGNPLVYDPNGEFPLSKAQAFDTRSKEVSTLVEVKSANTPKQVWDDSRSAGSQDHKFTLNLVYHAEQETDADYKISDEPVMLGTHDIFIGVKGDYNLDDVVSVDDAQNTLKYYTEHYVAGNKSYKLNDDPSLDGEDGLIFYLVNVRFRVDDADSEMENPQTVSADDAQCILKYYTENDVAGNARTWEDIVGYDLLDSFYQGKA